MSEKKPVRICLLLITISLTMSQDCSQPYDCPSDTPPCSFGTSLVPDGCGFCKVCAKQQGEPCSIQEPCDHHKGLYCDFAVLSDTDVGICTARDGQTCDLGGVIYRNGETFQPSCKHHCVCMNGEIGCMPTCANDVWLPTPDCPYPRRFQIPGKCCDEWVCDQTPQDQLFESAMSGGSDVQPLVSSSSSLSVFQQVSSRGLVPENPRVNCIVQTTEWSKCSATCGMGVSSHITNDNDRCQLRRETRICMIRLCNADQDKDIKAGKKCIRTPKALHSMRFELSGCFSTRLYQPKFCGVCTDKRCCTPHTTITAEVEFHCPEGDVFKKRMMFIKTCSCHHDCPQDNDIFLASNTRRMIGDYENEM